MSGGYSSPGTVRFPPPLRGVGLHRGTAVVGSLVWGKAMMSVRREAFPWNGTASEAPSIRVSYTQSRLMI
jgi:hypothetical protein